MLGAERVRKRFHDTSPVKRNKKEPDSESAIDRSGELEKTRVERPNSVRREDRMDRL